MRKYSQVLPLAAVLVVGVCFLSIARGRDDEKSKLEAVQAAAVDIQKLADALDQPDELKKQTDAIVKRYKDLSPIMGQLKTPQGIMPVGQPIRFPNDSIELELLMLAKKRPTADKLAAQAAALQQMADVIRAVAEVTPHYSSQFAKSAGARRRWNGFAGDMAERARELAKDVKAGDFKNLPLAAGRLNVSCNECHTAMRDGSILDDIEQAAAAVNKAEMLKTRAATLVRLYALDSVSRAFEPREKGGLGAEPPPDPGAPTPLGTFVPYGRDNPRRAPRAAVPDGIEARLLDWAKNPPTADQLAADAKDLLHSAEVARVLAEVMPDYGKEYAADAATAKTWGGYSDEMKQGSDDLIAAVKGKDLKALQKALDRLNQSCTDCHKAFR